MELTNNKSWAALRLFRKEYEFTRPWKRVGWSRKDFEAVIIVLPTEMMDDLRLEADAEELLANLFGG